MTKSSLTPADIHWCLLNVCGEQWMWAQWGGWCISAVVTAVWKTSHILDGQHSCQSMTLRLSQSVHLWVATREFHTELNISFNALETVVEMLEYYRVYTMLIPWVLTQEQKEHHTQLCQNLMNQYNAESDSFLDHIVTSETRCGITTVNQKQKSYPWSGNNWIPQQRKSSRHSPQCVRWCALSFGIGKEWCFWIFWNLDELSTST